MSQVTFVCPNLQAGGAERHWSLLLPRLAASGFRVHALTLDGTGPFYDELVGAGISTRTVAGRGRLGPLFAVLMLLRDPGEVLISRGTSADAVGFLVRRLRPRVRWLVNWHYPTGMPLPPRRRRILRHILRRADGIVAVCSSQLDDLVALGVAPDDVSVIPNGSDFQPADDARSDARAELGLTENDVAVLQVGRLERQKRVDRFVDVVASAQRAAPAIVGLIAGAGEEHARIAEQIDRSGARIALLGRRGDMPRLLAASDVLTLMSDYEALPFVVLEAMASARPVVASAVGGLPDAVLDGETGLLFAPGADADAAAALVRLAGDPRLRAALGDAGRRRAQERFDVDQMAQRYADLCRTLTAARGSRGSLRRSSGRPAPR